MRKVILVLLLILFSSCWETLPDGRKYMLLKHCVKSHEETSIKYNPALEAPELSTETICDSGYYDTIWKKDN